MPSSGQHQSASSMPHTRVTPKPPLHTHTTHNLAPLDGGGASAGSGASLGLSLNAAPLEVGELFASRESARLATEMELANKGRAIKKAAALAAAKSTSLAKPARHGLSRAASRRRRTSRSRLSARPTPTALGAGVRPRRLSGLL